MESAALTRRGLSAGALKVIAILAMTADHIAWLFFPGYPKELLPLALEAAGCFRRRLRVDQLELKLTIGAADPGDAAIRYGQANALLGSIWQPLTEAFHVEEGRARVEVDFTAAAPVLTGQVSLSLKLYQLLWLGLHFGLRALSTYVNHRNRHKQQREAV